jgi:hypothetical protein
LRCIWVGMGGNPWVLGGLGVHSAQRRALAPNSFLTSKRNRDSSSIYNTCYSSARASDPEKSSVEEDNWMWHRLRYQCWGSVLGLDDQARRHRVHRRGCRARHAGLQLPHAMHREVAHRARHVSGLTSLTVPDMPHPCHHQGKGAAHPY